LARNDKNPASGGLGLYIDALIKGTSVKCLVVVTHPLNQSLCNSLASDAILALQYGGHEVMVENLYESGFNPALSAAERATYYGSAFDQSDLTSEIERLCSADALILVFPTWWFGFPAMLKGWFDRVWAPGVAYDHATDFGPIKPRLSKLRQVVVVTTMGSPWWVDWLVMRRPVRRVLKTAILGTCTFKCAFKMHTLYKSENLRPETVVNFKAAVKRTLASLGSSLT
jgi:NAD(P)H dehydrogenase (quinone)